MARLACRVGEDRESLTWQFFSSGGANIRAGIAMWAAGANRPSLRRSQVTACAEGATAAVRVVDTGGLKGNVLIAQRAAASGDVLVRDAGLWVMREGPDFELLRVGSTTRFIYVQGTQTVVDGYGALSLEQRKEVLQLFCPSEASEAMRSRYGEMGELLAKKVQLPAGVSVEEAWRALRIFQRNAQGTQLQTGKWTVAVYPILSRICHSCAPNINYEVTRDGYLEVSAKSAIAAGEELCQSYLSDAELAWPAEKRRMKTLRVWDFNCACPRCVAEAS